MNSIENQKPDHMPSQHTADVQAFLDFFFSFGSKTARQRVLTRTSHSSSDMLYEPDGWAWIEGVLDFANQVRNVTVEVVDLDTGITYTVPLESFYQFGKRIERGNGPELFLPLELWTVSKGTG